MKILFYTDLHFRYNGDFFQISKSGHSNLLDELTRSLTWLESVIEEQKPDLVVCGGDIYHSMNSLDSHTVTVSFSALKHLCGVCESVGSQHIILLGNHDFISEDRTVSIIDFLNNFNKTQVINSLTKIDNLLFCPYYFAKENMSIPDEFLQQNKSSIFFGHLSLQGGYYKQYKKINQTLAETSFENLTQQVKSFRLAFNGHHHIPQVMGNVVFPGSFIQVNIDEPEMNIGRGVYLIDSETFSYKLIQNKSYSRMYRTYSPEELVSIPDNSYVYFGNDNPEVIRSVSQELKRFLGHRTEKFSSNSEKKKSSDTSVEVSTLSNTELLEHYVSKIEIKSNVNSVLSFGKGCLNEASSSAR
mgnify:CR=1 FL=1